MPPVAVSGNASPAALHVRGEGASAIIANACPFTVYTNIVHSPRAGDSGAPKEVSPLRTLYLNT